MTPYKKKQIEELKQKFPNLLNFDSLYKNYRNKPLQLEAKIISALVEKKEVTLEQFLPLIEQEQTKTQLIILVDGSYFVDKLSRATYLKQDNDGTYIVIQDNKMYLEDIPSHLYTIQTSKKTVCDLFV